LKSAVQAEPKERCWLILCLWSSLDALDGRAPKVHGR